MTDITKTEERLFMLLDTVEKQAEQNAQLQQQLSELNETVSERLSSLSEEVNTSLIITQNRFDNIVYTSTQHLLERHIPPLLDAVIREQSNFKYVENALDNAVKDLNQKINGNSSVYNSLHTAAIDHARELADAIEYQHHKVMTSSLKVTAIISLGSFLLMAIVFGIAYMVVVPTDSELAQLRANRDSLQRQITYLQTQRQQYQQPHQQPSSFFSK